MKGRIEFNHLQKFRHVETGEILVMKALLDINLPELKEQRVEMYENPKKQFLLDEIEPYVEPLPLEPFTLGGEE